MTYVLECVDATVSKRGTAILDSVSFSTEQGQHWVILGPNGAGKTTLIRALAGREALAQGTVKLDGEDIFALDRQELASALHLFRSRLPPPFVHTKLFATLFARQRGVSQFIATKNTKLKMMRVATICLLLSVLIIWRIVSLELSLRAKRNVCCLLEA